MMQQQNPTSDRPNFQIRTKRPAQTRAARWWKLLERVSLILGLTGFSITSLIAGVEKYFNTMQTLAALQTKIGQLEVKLTQLEQTNARLENELNFMKGRLERTRLETQATATNGGAHNEATTNARSAILPSPRETTREETAPQYDMRAPLHIIDKLSMTINYAYSKARGTNPKLAGRLLVRCKMDEEGNLSASEVIALDAEVETVAASVRDKVRRWNFPETVTGLEKGNFQKTYFLTPSGF